MSGRLRDRVAIVTGAGCVGPGWGNGRATAVRFAEEGAKIFAVDRDLDSVDETVERTKAAGGEIVTHQCDVTVAASVEAMVNACLDRFDRVDVLVNNVGGSAHGGPVEMSEAAWDAQIDTNLKSVFLTLKYVLPVMERQRAGAIVNIASTSGLRWTGAAQVGYAATKAGVIQLSRVVAVQYADKGIRINTVVPGQLHTPMVEARLAKQRAGGNVEALLKSRLERIPIGFMGDGRDTANAALFLASDEARFVTGTEIVVDGGKHVERCPGGQSPRFRLSKKPMARACIAQGGKRHLALSKKRAASVALHSIGGCSASEKLRLGADGNVHARWHAFKILAAILCVAGLAWLGMAYLIPAPPSQITIATLPTGEHYHVLGTRYQGI
jgi:NAD(P)-dependent dehydrogenase (short-subunit alcohol dehydrogenase family)